MTNPTLDEQIKAIHRALENGHLAPNSDALRAAICSWEFRRHGHEEPCLLCSEPCNSIAGNPGLWPVRLGNNGWHHVKCINATLRDYATLQKRHERALAVVEAARPISVAADDLDDKTRDNSEIWELPCAMGITAGNLRNLQRCITAFLVTK